MIVFDIKCSASHVFEVWFASSASWEDQRERGLVVCPVCGDGSVEKAVMAPNISAKSNRSQRQDVVPLAKPDETTDAQAKALLAKLAQAQAKALESSNWVGKDFDRQARAMDAGEIDQTSIHGQVTHAQAKELIDDGIGVMPLLLPIVPPEQRN